MNRTLRFFRWKEGKWRERASAMSMSEQVITPEHDEGLGAYAKRQACLCQALHDKCQAKWRIVPEMKKRAKMEVAYPNLLFKRKAKERARIFSRLKGGVGMLGAIREEEIEAKRGAPRAKGPPGNKRTKKGSK
jgi:hypothetical protein